MTVDGIFKLSGDFQQEILCKRATALPVALYMVISLVFGIMYYLFFYEVEGWLHFVFITVIVVGVVSSIIYGFDRKRIIINFRSSEVIFDGVGWKLDGRKVFKLQGEVKVARFISKNTNLPTRNCVLEISIDKGPVFCLGFHSLGSFSESKLVHLGKDLVNRSKGKIRSIGF